MAEELRKLVRVTLIGASVNEQGKDYIARHNATTKGKWGSCVCLCHGPTLEDVKCLNINMPSSYVKLTCLATV